MHCFLRHRSRPSPAEASSPKVYVPPPAELNARYDKDEKNRFCEEFVVKVYDKHNSDNDDDKEYQAAAQENGFPKYCIVMEKGEQNLHEAMHAESLTGNINKVRPILEELARCLDHLHKEGYIHGDFKPKNAVRVTGKKHSWKLIDFDASVRKGAFVGKKFSSAYVPPEILFREEGKASVFVRASSVFESRQVPASWSCLEAHESFDVWSFGVVMFLLFTGESLTKGGDAVRDNLDESGLRERARWDKNALRQKMKLVHDLCAKELLKDLLHPEWNKRPSMEDVIVNYDFFDPHKLAEKKQILEMQLKYAMKSRQEDTSELKEELLLVNKKLEQYRLSQ